MSEAVVVMGAKARRDVERYGAISSTTVLFGTDVGRYAVRGAHIQSYDHHTHNKYSALRTQLVATLEWAIGAARCWLWSCLACCYNKRGVNERACC